MALKEPTLKETENFYKKKELIQKIILQTIKNKEIIYGEQAVKIRLPKHLQRYTKDYDVYSRTPKKDAVEAEKKLDKAFGGDYFYTEPAEHKGTYKVRSRINGEGYADFTEPERNYDSDKIKGHKYIKTKHIKDRIKEILEDKTQEFRHAKDRDTLNRLKILEKKKYSSGGSSKPKRKRVVKNKKSLWL